MARAKKNAERPAVLYTNEQLRKVEEHISRYFGEFESCYQEKDAGDIRLNFYIIPPDRKRPYYTVVTSGMGAHLMNVPDYEETANLRRAELVLCLPPSWDIDNNDHRYNWPFRLLTLLSRLPIREKAWLGKGHTVDYGVGFSRDTKLSSVLLLHPMCDRDAWVCELEKDDFVNFYQVIPLYDSELKYKNRYNTSVLLDRFGDKLSPVIDMERRPVVPDNFRNILDSVEDHTSKIVKKDLDLFDINAANHMAAFLRWMIDKNMLDKELRVHFADELRDIKNGTCDIRKFILTQLGGELTLDLFTPAGQAFADHYYDIMPQDEDSCYAEDVDLMALKYFGDEKYNCREFRDEAYLFVPYGEEYYADMKKYIDRAYRMFRKKLRVES